MLEAMTKSALASRATCVDSASPDLAVVVVEALARGRAYDAIGREDRRDGHRRGDGLGDLHIVVVGALWIVARLAAVRESSGPKTTLREVLTWVAVRNRSAARSVKRLVGSTCRRK